MKNKFDLYVLSFDGDIKKDSSHDSIESAENCGCDLGSKWFFYPWQFIAVGKTIRSAYGCFISVRTGAPCLGQKYNGRRIKTIVRDFKNASVMECNTGATAEEFEHYIIHEI